MIAISTKKFIFAAIAGTIVSTISGALIFGFILNPFQATHTVLYDGLMKETENYALAVVAQIPFALFMIYVFYHWKSKISYASGFVSGAIMGALIGLAFALMTLAQMNLTDWVVVLTDVIGHALWGGATGAVIAGILGSEDKG